MNRILDRRVQFDERSRNFPIRALIVEKRPRAYTWAVEAYLDQQAEGACVGFAWAHELSARPAVNAVTDELARLGIYREALKIDEWPGEEDHGTSVLAGAKVVQRLGYMKEYRWSFSLEELKMAVGYAGPAVLGLNWYEGMFDTGADGFVRVTGSVAGGHAILCYGISLKEKRFTLRNSWGRAWGQGGDCKISFDDMDRLLHEHGEACIPVGRLRKG